MMNLNTFKDDLLDSYLWNFIKTDNVIAVFLVGSGPYPELQDHQSDIDLMCLTRTKEPTLWPLYSFEYRNLVGHWAYWPIEEALLYKVPNDVVVERWHRNQGMQYFLNRDSLIWINPSYEWILDFIQENAYKRLIISTYVSFNVHWTPSYLTAENYYWPHGKYAWPLLLASYILQKVEPNWSLILKSKREKNYWKNKDLNNISSDYSLTPEEKSERKQQILWLQKFILKHPFNIPELMLELQTSFVKQLSVHNGITLVPFTEENYDCISKK